MTADVQVDPSVVTGGPTDMFVAGNDADAKSSATELARSYGWREIIDLGDIAGSRAMEVVLPMWLRVSQAIGTGLFNYRVVSDRARDSAGG